MKKFDVNSIKFPKGMSAKRKQAVRRMIKRAVDPNSPQYQEFQERAAKRRKGEDEYFEQLREEDRKAKEKQENKPLSLNEGFQTGFGTGIPYTPGDPFW